MKILVCGGAGYIGSHTVYELIEQGHEVVVADNLCKGHKAAVHKDAKLYVGDLRDAEFLDKVFAENKIDAVIDFAAFSLASSCLSLLINDFIIYTSTYERGFIRLFRLS